MSILIKNVLHEDTITDVLIEGNRIARIAPNLPTPEGAEVIDGTDKAVIPGFINTPYACCDDPLQGLRR